MAAERIESVGKVAQKIQKEELETTPNKDYFEALMEQRRVVTEHSIAQDSENARSSTSLMDEVSELNHKVNQANRSTPQEIADQAEGIIAQIDEIKTKLGDKDLQLQAPVQTLLKRKLTHIDDNLKAALTRAGVEYKAPEPPSNFQKPMDRFLRFLTHGQDQLMNLSDHIKSLNEQNGGMLQPADLLLVQIKVNYVQQELELFTSMLNKALESTKTLMNVQV